MNQQSENCRIIGVGRDFWRTLNPTPLLKVDSPSKQFLSEAQPYCMGSSQLLCASGPPEATEMFLQLCGLPTSFFMLMSRWAWWVFPLVLQIFEICCEVFKSWSMKYRLNLQKVVILSCQAGDPSQSGCVTELQGLEGPQESTESHPPFQNSYPTIGCKDVPRYGIESSIVCDEEITFYLVLIPYQIVINEHQMELNTFRVTLSLLLLAQQVLLLSFTVVCYRAHLQSSLHAYWTQS